MKLPGTEGIKFCWNPTEDIYWWTTAAINAVTDIDKRAFDPLKIIEQFGPHRAYSQSG